MPRFLSLFMILLLALRGLAGDAMAMGIAPAAQPVAAVAVAAISAEAHHSSTHMDHSDMHGEHTAASPAAHAICGQDASSGSASDCAQHEGHCTACGICHSALAAPQCLGLLAPKPAPLSFANGKAVFASAAPAQLSKPPISEV